MSSSATVRVMSPEEITTLGSSDVPHLRLPERTTCFAEREMRLRQLARQGGAMSEFLGFMAEVAHAQQQALAQHPAVPLPDADALSRATLRGQPAVPAADWVRDAAWRTPLGHILSHAARHATASGQAAIERLQGASAEWLDAQATALLDGTRSGLDLAAAPFIGAALQVYWAHLVSAVQAQHPDMQPSSLFGRTDEASACPCCGSLPVASITRNVGGAMAQRYLHCSLCGSEWHLQRTQCTHCGERGKLAYQALDAMGNDAEASARAAQAPVQAETCDHCHHYLKILHTERDPFLDPVADDLASVALDLLVADTGMRRHGTNLALIFGDAEAP